MTFVVCRKKISKVGTSACLIVPASVIRDFELKIGDEVLFYIEINPEAYL